MCDGFASLVGLKINRDRPDNKLPYRGAWLWIGPEMIHLMELPNPDATEGRPVHGGRDTHICVSVESIELLVKRLTDAGVKYTESMSGRPAVFFKDPGKSTCCRFFAVFGDLRLVGSSLLLRLKSSRSAGELPDCVCFSVSEIDCQLHAQI